MELYISKYTSIVYLKLYINNCTSVFSIYVRLKFHVFYNDFMYIYLFFEISSRSNTITCTEYKRVNTR